MTTTPHQPDLREKDGSIVVRVRVQPRASRSGITDIREDGVVLVRLQAPPVDGAANKALLQFLGRTVLGLAPSALTLVQGQTGRDKAVSVSGISRDHIARRLIDAVGKP